jgi:nardilysin
MHPLTTLLRCFLGCVNLCRAARLRPPDPRIPQGNAKSLVTDVEAHGLSLRKLLLAHHSKHYRAGRMTLALVAAEPLDTLEAWVRELFGRVPSGGVPRPDFAPHGSMIAGSTGVLFRVPAVKEAHDLVFTFALPPLHREYDAKPDEYASHLLGHEGAGSLLSALKARSWASALCAGVSEGGHERSSAAWLFSVGVTLTEAGLAAWRDVAALVFQYIRLLRDAGPQRFVFDELRAVKEQEFRFAEEEDGAEYVSRLAASAERYRPEHAVAGEYLLTRFDPAAVVAVLSALTPHNCRFDLQSSSFVAATPETLAAPVDGQPGAAAFREPWMDVPFGRAPLPRALLDAWAAAAPAADLALPPRNAFLATDFALRGSGTGGAPAEDDDTAFPLVDGTAFRAPAAPLRLPLRDSARFRVWHKLDGLGGRFGAPRAAAFWAFTPSSHAAGGPPSKSSHSCAGS